MALSWIYLGNTKLSELTDEQSEFYDALIWATTAVDIGYLCEESAEEFARRLEHTRIIKDTGKKTPEEIAEMLKPFYGLRTNVQTLSSIDWAIKHFARREYKPSGSVDKFGEEWVNKIDEIAYSPENEKKERLVEVENALRKCKRISPG